METTIHYQQFIEILENYQRQSFEPMMDNSMDSITDLSCYSYERNATRARFAVTQPPMRTTEFSRRTVQKGRSDFVCLKTGTCEITPNNRSWCRLCRWKRCLIVGMVPNGL
ncbi:unnamed protein product, partial [Mesorhabditis belari]|uniref:Nuclear receptor domain-containing protein n=1 Tax=Mesorhabditis belari TaxID=2138241 RepID=A0AAF3EPY6_9BILA